LLDPKSKYSGTFISFMESGAFLQPKLNFTIKYSTNGVVSL
jgi:hypothetical protein